MVVVFGGSFNPPTIAHLEMIKKILDEFNEAKVLLLPVGDDYKKKNLASFEDRIKMLKLLTKDLKKTIVSRLESQIPYQGTLASLKELSKTYNNIVFLIGSDQLKTLDLWIDYKELLAKFKFLIMTRKNSLSETKVRSLFSKLKYDFTFIAFDQDISSTQVRDNKETREKKLTKEVFEYIQKKNLYRE